MSKNTTPEDYDVNIEQENTPQEELLMNEHDILAGLLELGNSKDESANYRKIQIRRDGVLKLEFRIRPVTEDETQACLRRANKYTTPKSGQPKKLIETDSAKFRSYLIYTATVDEDRAKVWDNKRAQEELGILHSVDMIDRVILAGEKSRILDIIDEISGYDEEAEETAKN